nr:MAG TPA: hypothetical protein [Caudoviricetes sp.]
MIAHAGSLLTLTRDGTVKKPAPEREKICLLTPPRDGYFGNAVDTACVITHERHIGGFLYTWPRAEPGTGDTLIFEMTPELTCGHDCTKECFHHECAAIRTVKEMHYRFIRERRSVAVVSWECPCSKVRGCLGYYHLGSIAYLKKTPWAEPDLWHECCYYATIKNEGGEYEVSYE